MTKNGESTAIAVLQEYPPAQFNLLIPVKTLQEISPIHTIQVNKVQISANPKDGDVYVQDWHDREKKKPKALSFTKKALANCMAAAAIQHLETTPIPPQKCTKCYEVAQATRVAPKCFECPHQDDIAFRVTVAVPQPSGQYRIVRATKEMRMADERKKMTAAQFDKFFPYRTEHCETRALNRALREALGIKGSYEPDELQKEFVVALVVPNYNDPDMKKAMVDRYARGMDDLFGTPKVGAGAAPQVGALADGRTVDKETGEILGDVQDAHEVARGYTDPDDAPPDFDFDDEPEPIGCEGDDCGGIITTVTDRQGNTKTPEEFAEWTMRRYGRKLCEPCAKRAAGAAQRRGA